MSTITAPPIVRHEDGTITGPTTVEEWLDAMWWGDALGWSEHQLAHDLASYRRDLANLEAGRITPRSVIGTGYKSPKTVARRWLTQRIEATVEALATRGRSHAINRTNAAHFAKHGTGDPSRWFCACNTWSHDVPLDADREATYRGAA